MNDEQLAQLELQRIVLDFQRREDVRDALSDVLGTSLDVIEESEILRSRFAVRDTRKTYDEIGGIQIYYWDGAPVLATTVLCVKTLSNAHTLYHKITYEWAFHKITPTSILVDRDYLLTLYKKENDNKK